MTSSAENLRIDIDRLLERLADLAAIGAIEGTEGSARLALTDEDKAGRDLVVAAMKDLDLDITIDGIGNVVAVMPGATSGPPVMCGSHIDTVRTGGRYDGNLGVLAGLEIIEVVKAAGLTPHRPLAVAFFTDEEGARFAPDMLGSLVYVGGMALEDALAIEGIDGAIVGPELKRIGYDGTSPLPASPPYAFVELHIEQGPVLEAEGITIGAVESVQGISWQEVTVTGQSNHAGTTPMNLRKDPGSWRQLVRTLPVRWPLNSALHKSPRSGGSNCAPTSSTSCPHRQPSPSTYATPTKRFFRSPRTASPSS